MYRLLVSTLLLILIAQSCLAEPVKYTFTVDGRSFDPDCISLTGHPEAPASGDIVRVDDYWLVLDDNPTWDLVRAPREEGLLYRKHAKGRDIVAVTVQTRYMGDERKLINPLIRMSADEKAALRGVWLDAWDETIAKLLLGLKPDTTALSISDWVQDGRKALPALPKDLRYLAIDEHSNQGIRNYERLADLKSLVVLKVRAMTGELPAEHLSVQSQLRHLELNNLGSNGIDGLAKLTNLRTLLFPFSTGIKNIDFARGYSELVQLDLRGTAVKDLQPLEGLKKLALIRADNAPVATLPKRLPSLRRLDAFSTQLTDEQTEVFRKANPDCVVRHRWEKTLRDAAAKADRIRVRTGGTCHRREAEEKTLADVKDVKAISELLAAIRIDESSSAEHCMCCGDPSLEFYAGEKLVLTLGFHHGRSLRWVGSWPADASLADKSAEEICKWLAAQGVRGPLQNFEENGRRDAAARRRLRMVEAVIPKDVLQNLKAAKSREEAFAAFEDGIPDAAKRADVYFRMIGCGDADWSLSFGPDELAIKLLLPRLKGAAVSTAAKGAKDVTALAGAGRWLFSEKKWADLPKDDLNDVVCHVAEHALAHPRLGNRRLTMAALKDVDTPGSRELLHRVFDGKIKVRQLDKDDEAEPSGMRTFRPNQDMLERGSDAAQAARLLAELGDKTIRAEAEKRLGSAKGADKTLYEAAIEKLPKQ